VGNAVKFTEKGSVELFMEPTENQHLSLIVKDTGVGIKPEYQEKLFQIFSQGDSSMARRYGGTGLGLLLSKKMAQVLGGDVVLKESVEGSGSTFVITIEDQPKGA
jgi:signal transduction histidine kinase